MTENRIAERFTCTCERLLRLPKRSGGSCRVKTPVDRLVEVVVYGLGGALLGLGLAIMILSQFRFGRRHFSSDLGFVAILTIVGFLAGLLGGERGINWLGGWIQDREDR